MSINKFVYISLTIITAFILLISSAKTESNIDKEVNINILMPAPFAESTKHIVDNFNREN